MQQRKRKTRTQRFMWKTLDGKKPRTEEKKSTKLNIGTRGAATAKEYNHETLKLHHIYNRKP